LSSICVRALVLTAGVGSRLRPLTHEIPKALLPVLGSPLVFRTLDCLRAIGCEEVVLNLHHLGDQISAAVGDQYDDMPVRYSREVELLGTLGGIAAVKEFLSDCDVALVVNGDSLCEWPLSGLIERHLEADCPATLFVTPHADAAAFGGVGVRGGDLVSLPPDAVPDTAVARVFAGAHALRPDLIRGVEKGKPDLIPHLYRPLLVRGERLAVYEASPPWHDLGTPARYLDAMIDWAGETGWSSHEVSIAQSATIERSVIEGVSRIADGAEIHQSLLLDGCSVGEGATLVRTIIGPGVEIPAGTEIENTLLMLDRGASGPMAHQTTIDP
jgi:mannose-1-phosphate guanylyltransferase